MYASRSNVIAKAAAFVRGDRLDRLQAIVESQKTISTARLERELDRLREDARLDGIFLKAIADRLPPDAQRGEE